MSQALKFLAFSGSLRKASCNTGLLRAARARLPEGVSLEVAELGDLPFFNADLSEKPASVLRFFEQLAGANALVMACPEYNYSLAPALKNALDWASREPGNQLLQGKPAAIMGAGGGMGTSRAQHHLRQVMVCLDIHPLNKPEVFANAFTPGVFDSEGNLLDERIGNLISDQLQALAQWARRLQT